MKHYFTVFFSNYHLKKINKIKKLIFIKLFTNFNNGNIRYNKLQIV